MGEPIFEFGQCGETHHKQALRNAGLSMDKINKIPTTAFCATTLATSGFTENEIKLILAQSHLVNSGSSQNTDDLFD